MSQMTKQEAVAEHEAASVELQGGVQDRAMGVAAEHEAAMAALLPPLHGMVQDTAANVATVQSQTERVDQGTRSFATEVRTAMTTVQDIMLAMEKQVQEMEEQVWAMEEQEHASEKQALEMQGAVILLMEHVAAKGARASRSRGKISEMAVTAAQDTAEDPEGNKVEMAVPDGLGDFESTITAVQHSRPAELRLRALANTAQSYPSIEQGMSRFWIEKGGRKRRKSMCFFFAQSIAQVHKV